MNLLLTTLGPIRLVTADPTTSGADPARWYLAGAALLLAAGALGAWLLRRWLVRRQPEERAFLALALLRGLGPGSISLLRRLAAAHGRAAPVALLISPEAFGAAARCFARLSTTERERRSLRALCRRLGAP